MRTEKTDWADAQADMRLRWVHKSFCWFCCAATLLSFIYHQIIIHLIHFSVAKLVTRYLEKGLNFKCFEQMG